MPTTFRVKCALAALVSTAVIGSSCGSAPRATEQTTGPAAAPPQPARIARIENASQLLTGPGATGRIGDYRLENGRVVFVIDQIGPGHGFAFSGGNLVDAAPAGGHDELAQVFGYHGSFPRQPVWERLTTRQEDRGAAVIRVEGRDSEEPRILLVTDYVLYPGVDVLLMRTQVINQTGAPLEQFPVGDVIQWGSTRHFAPGPGFDLEGEWSGRWVAGVGTRTSYAYVATEGDIAGPSGSTWSDFIAQRVDVPAGGIARAERLFVVGDRGDVASALGRALWARREETGKIVGFAFDRRTRQPVTDARLEISDAEGRPYANVAANAQGALEADLPAGRYSARAWAPGRTGPAAFPVVLRPGSVSRGEVDLSAPGRLVVEIRDPAAGEGPAGRMPGRITLRGIAPTPDPFLGPEHEAAGSGPNGYTPTGVLTLPVPPGRYRLTVSRGPEYAIANAEVTVPEGGTARAAAALRRVVDTTGYVACDFHQHTTQSADAASTLRDRLVANAGEGLEVVAITDHNTVPDVAGALAPIHLDRRLLVLPGVEVTTDGMRRASGHYNVFPLAYSASAARGGAPQVWDLPASQLLRRLHELGQGHVVQVNHPRWEREGFFNLTAFDAATGRGGEHFSAQFDVLEIWNSRFQDAVPQVMTDWFALIRAGHRPTGTANSDTHRIFGSEPGYPRTFLRVETETVAELRPESVVQSLREGRDAVMSNGPFVRLRIGDVGIGGIAPVPRGTTAQLHVEVQAAAWVNVTQLIVYVDGQALDPIAIPPHGDGELHRFETDVPVTVSDDSFVLAVVRGTEQLPILPPSNAQLPLAITNPIWIDATGDGRWSAPAPRPAPATTAEPATPATPTARPPRPRPRPRPRPTPPRRPNLGGGAWER
ncbi:MAG: PHP domain-containing protein [Deltaproteobacteria bacterium]|nr:PHP domain-containing protein [Deltaproteobacteria bacterium]